MISFIIPLYNAEKFILRCLNSIVNQSINCFEIIIVNDGSTDNSLQIINEFIIKNSEYNIKVFTIINSGPGIARNYGVTKALNEYIWFVDIDDYLYNNISLSTVINYLAQYKPDIFIFSALENRQKKANKIWRFTNDVVLTDINQKPTLLLSQQWPWNKIIKRSFLLNSRIEFSNKLIFEDIYFFSDLYLQASSIVLVPDIFYVYVKHDKAITASLKNFKSYPRALLYEFKTFLNVVSKKIDN